MRITKRSNIAMRVLMYCAANTGGLVTKAEIAQRCKISESHLAQVINKLARLDYLHTQRGRSGGIALARPADQIVIGEIFRHLEAPVTQSECFADVDNSCPLVSACRLRAALADAVHAFFAHLDGITLDALVCNNPRLHAIFAPEACAQPRKIPVPIAE